MADVSKSMLTKEHPKNKTPSKAKQSGQNDLIISAQNIEFEHMQDSFGNHAATQFLEQNAHNSSTQSMRTRADELLRILPTKSAYVNRVFDELPANDRDDLAHEIALRGSDAKLKSIAADTDGKSLLMRFVQELQSGWTTGGMGLASPKSEASEIERLIRIISPSHAYLKAEPWSQSPEIQNAFGNSGTDPQSIHSGGAAGDYVYDEYSVTILKMPENLSPEDYLLEMATDLNRAVQNELFDKINEFKRIKTDRSPKVGDIYHIDIWGPDNGSVMLVERSSNYFIFQTIETNQDGTHPEYGSRQFGFETNSNGTITFYTRGASRPFFGSASIGRIAQDKGWTAMMEGIANTIQNKGGTIKQGSLQSWTTHRSDQVGSGIL
ncbi:MAG: hypothetical protein ACOYNY_23650 [Caldilineaceae bacterium]